MERSLWHLYHEAGPAGRRQLLDGLCETLLSSYAATPREIVGALDADEAAIDERRRLGITRTVANVAATIGAEPHEVADGVRAAALERTRAYLPHPSGLVLERASGELITVADACLRTLITLRERYPLERAYEAALAAGIPDRLPRSVLRHVNEAGRR